MARTKYSARKATGAPAPREPIPKAAPSQKQIALAETSTPECDDSLRRSQRKRKDPPAQTQHKLVKITVVSETPINHLQAIIPGPIDASPLLRYDRDHDDHCCACRNGGAVHPCSTCLRSICNNCVAVPESSDSDFATCPFCYLQQKEKKKKGAHPPYQMLGLPIRFIGDISIRERYPRCTSESVVVIDISLQGFPYSRASRIVYETLQSYTKTHIVHVHLDYSFQSQKDIASYEARSSEIVDLFTGTGDFAELGCRRFSVFLTSHSDPKRGDLHFAPKGKGSNTPLEVLSSLFGGRFGTFLGGCESDLTLLVCGSIVTIDSALDDIKKFHEKGIFKTILGFTQSNLMDNFCEKFLADRAVHRYANLQESVDSYIYDHQSLGSHTDMVFVESYLPVHKSSNGDNLTGLSLGQKEASTPETVAIRYRWSHGTIRPFGHQAPVQCNKCYVLKPWLSKLSNDRYILKCQTKECQNSLTYAPFEGAAPITSAKRGQEVTKEERGVWYKQFV